MRIALVVPGGVDPSGEYRIVPALVSLIARLAVRHEVLVFALQQQPQPASWQLAGAQIHNIGAQYTRWRAVRAICAEHRRSAFDVLHAVWSGAPGVVAVSAARYLHVPVVVHLGGGELVALRDIGYGGRLKWRGRMREALVLHAASVVTAASAPMIESLARLGIVARRVPLGTDLARWPAQLPVPRDANQPARLIHTASLNRVKDQPTLLKALKVLADAGREFTMDIVGADTLGGQIQSLAQTLGLCSRVRFHGFLPQRLLLPLVKTAHLLLMSSRHEAGPLAVLEAAAMGVPTVGTAVGHIAEWSPAAAACVPVGDWAALARVTAALLDDEERRLQMGREAMGRAVLEDADFTAKSFQAIYAELAA